MSGSAEINDIGSFAAVAATRQTLVDLSVTATLRSSARARAHRSGLNCTVDSGEDGCPFNDRPPVTIRFADAIGDILVAGPHSNEPVFRFKFHI